MFPQMMVVFHFNQSPELEKWDCYSQLLTYENPLIKLILVIGANHLRQVTRQHALNDLEKTFF